MDDFYFVDVEGDMEGEGSRSVNSKKKDVLEEGTAKFIEFLWNLYVASSNIILPRFRSTIL